MRIKWLGHAAFLITSDSDTKIITDPYETSEGLKYGEIKETADIVTISHEHGDHSNAATVQGNPQVIEAYLGRQRSGGRKIDAQSGEPE